MPPADCPEEAGKLVAAKLLTVKRLAVLTAGSGELTDRELELYARDPRTETILALRMLFSSVCKGSQWSESYDLFMHQLEPRLLASLQPLHVLQFWQRAANIQHGKHWLAVFAIDQVATQSFP